MSTTTNIQNLLVNVFRPVYSYENGVFRPRLALSNVDSVSANSYYGYNLRIGDPACNVYVGSNAGNFYTDSASLKGSASNVALGVAAAFGISNASNCVYIGYNSLQTVAGSSNNVVIGANTVGNGSSNIILGAQTRLVSGSSNILIGTNLDVSTSTTNRFYLGNGANNITLASDLAARNLGINNPAPNSAFALDVSGYTYVKGGLGINDDPRDYTLNVNGNFRVQNGYGVMIFDTPLTDVIDASSGDTLVTLNSYTSGKKAVLDVSGNISADRGFYSSRGTTVVGNTSNVSIGVLRQGIIMVSAHSGTTTSYDAETVFVRDTATPSVIPMTSNVASGGTNVNFTANSINISNTSGGSLTYTWSITYFPTS